MVEGPWAAVKWARMIRARCLLGGGRRISSTTAVSMLRLDRSRSGNRWNVRRIVAVGIVVRRIRCGNHTRRLYTIRVSESRRRRRRRRDRS